MYEDLTETEYDAVQWQEWPLRDEVQEALLEACDGDDENMEAYAAYFREFADKDRPYTAQQVKTMGENAFIIRYDDWESVGDEWIADTSGTALIDTLMGVADDHQTTVLHELVKQVGRTYAPRKSEWWYETGLLADGLIYCFNRP